ncbi:MAG: ATP synthase subunit I [Bacteroidota bacterium]
MMNEIPYMILSFIGGMLLGIIFFGGLWFTVNKIVASKIPALWIFVSFTFRVSIVLIGFYFIGSGNWQRLIACMLGFIIARFVVLHYTKTIDENKLQIKREADREA